MGYTFLFISLILLPNIIFYELIGNLPIDYTFLLAFAGGIGFAISLIHHYLFWNLSFYPKTKYRNFFKILRSTRLLEMKSNEKSLIYSLKMSQSNYKGKYNRNFQNLFYINKKRRIIGEKDYWRILNIIWHRLRHEDPSFEMINSRNDSLTDLMHANGSSLVALILASLTTFTYTLYYNTYMAPINFKDNIFFCLTVVTFTFAFILHFCSYKFTVQNLNRFCEDALFHTLMIRSKMNSQKNSKKKNGPLIFHINSTDLSD